MKINDIAKGGDDYREAKKSRKEETDRGAQEQEGIQQMVSRQGHQKLLIKRCTSLQSFVKM